MSWARKRHRNIRREDLIAYLLDKTPPRRSRSTAAVALPNSVCRLTLERSASPLQVPRFSAASEANDANEPDLQPFRDALALQGKLKLFYTITSYKYGQYGM